MAENVAVVEKTEGGTLADQPQGRSLGSDPDIGWVKLDEVINQSSNRVRVIAYGKTHDIEPGKDDGIGGFIPYYNAPEKYFQIHYYNKVLKKQAVIYIKDLKGDWLVSFSQDNKIEHTTNILPGPNITFSVCKVIVKDHGFEILQLGNSDSGFPDIGKGGLFFWNGDN